VNRRRTTRRMGWVEEEVQDVERAGMVASPSTVMQIPRMLLGGGMWRKEEGAEIGCSVVGFFFLRAAVVGGAGWDVCG
jgi:hypothetical protein